MTTATLSTRPRLLAWIGLGLTSGAAWLGLAALGHGAGDAPLSELCLTLLGPELAAYPAAAAMWVLMSAAMMLPTAAPTIDLHVRLTRRVEMGRAIRIAGFAAGYLLAWAGFALLTTAAQVLVAEAVGTNPLPAGTAAGGLLLVAGLYQLTPLKAACLALCRNPLAFFMSHWREGSGGALMMGVHHGLICIGCCWALMLLMFVAGTMNLAWMAGLGLVMLLEKVLPRADRMGRLGGIALVLAGTALVLDAVI